MIRSRYVFIVPAAVAVLAAILLPAASASSTPSPAEKATSPSEQLIRSIPGDFHGKYAETNGIRTHYIIGGEGDPIVLLHGWPENWWAFHKVMPTLAEKYTVIVPELRGIGETDKPGWGYDKKTMAKDLHDLVRSLGYDRVNVVGHDIGALVAYSFAANHAEAVNRLVIMDATIPDSGLYNVPIIPTSNQNPDVPGNDPFLWWFAFNQLKELPQQLVRGREELFLNWFFDRTVNPAAITARDRKIYARAYSRPGVWAAANGWYQSIRQDIADNNQYQPTAVPTMVLASENLYDYMAFAWPSKGTDILVKKIDGAGHFIPEEKPAEVVREIEEFVG